MPKRASAVISHSIVDDLIELEADRLKSSLLTAIELARTASVLPYKAAKVFDYARTYCRGGNDCPDDTFANDCTHFLAHCLNATGVAITNASAKCAKGLAIRVNDLAAALSNSVAKFSNVTQIASHAGTLRGDYCFIPGWFGLTKTHGMLLSSTASSTGASVYAHTNDRCGETVLFEGEACVYYRIEDA